MELNSKGKMSNIISELFCYTVTSEHSERFVSLANISFECNYVLYNIIYIYIYRRQQMQLKGEVKSSDLVCLLWQFFGNKEIAEAHQVLCTCIYHSRDIFFKKT